MAALAREIIALCTRSVLLDVFAEVAPRARNRDNIAGCSALVAR